MAHAAASCLIVAIALTACTTTTGTRVSPTAPQLSLVKRLGTTVRTEETFSVRRDRDRMTATGAALGGLLGAAIEAGARASSDGKYEETLTPALGGLDVARVMSDRMVAALRATPTFASAERVETGDLAALRSAGFDGVLEVALAQWGLRLCTTSYHTDDLQAGYRAHGRLRLVTTGAVIWERHELFLDGECRPADAFRMEAGALPAALTRAADGLARRIVNDLLFP